MQTRFQKLFNFFSLALVAISLPLTVYILKNGNLDFTIEAFLSDEPQNVVISNINGESFKVSWYTEKPTTGMLRLSGSLEPYTEPEDTKYHELNIVNLDPNSNYEFQLLSNGNLFTQTYSTNTYPDTLNQDNHWLIGQVFSMDGYTPQNGGLVYLTLIHNGINSAQTVSIINENGGYKINLANLRDNNGNSFNHNTYCDVLVKVYTSSDSEVIEKRFTLDLALEKQIPNIYLAEPGLDLIPGVEGR
ncbi:MAG TPA: hypothetical protein PKU95_04190 [Candidatus Dojkabacteria bacterium]|nr:hypothetical protein [Candidatus Dojkabacteria bacterium]